MAETLDDLPQADYDKAERAILRFRKSKKTRTDEHILYDALTNVGLSAEYADEFINLELEG